MEDTNNKEPTTANFFAESRNKLEQYVQDRLLLLKMQLVAKLSEVVALLFSALVIALLAFFILLFVSIMAGYYFAALTKSLYIGFGIVAFFYVLLLLVIIQLRKKVIEKKIIDMIVRICFTDKAEKSEAHE